MFRICHSAPMAQTPEDALTDYKFYDDLGGEKYSPAGELSISEIVLLCSPFVASTVGFFIEFMLATPTMVQLGISSFCSTIIWMFFSISCIFVRPLSIITDNFFQFKYHRRIQIFVGGIGIIIGLLLLLMLKCYTDSKVLFIISFVIVITSAFLIQSETSNLVSDTIPQSQNTLSEQIRLFLFGSSIVISGLIGGLISEKAFIIVTIILVTFSIMAGLFSPADERAGQSLPKYNPFSDMFRTMLNFSKRTVSISVVYVLAWMAFFPVLIFETDFFMEDIFKSDRIKGVKFGIFVVFLSSTVGFVFSQCQAIICEKLGQKVVLAASQAVLAIFFPSVLFISDRFVLIVILCPISAAFCVFYTIPCEMLERCVPKEKFGVHRAAIESLASIGRQISLWIVAGGVGALTSRRAPIIASCAIFAILAFFAAIRVDVPPAETTSVALLDVSSK